jgi:hypothetical protein
MRATIKIHKKIINASKTNKNTNCNQGQRKIANLKGADKGHSRPSLTKLLKTKATNRAKHKQQRHRSSKAREKKKLEKKQKPEQSEIVKAEKGNLQHSMTVIAAPL